MIREPSAEKLLATLTSKAAKDEPMVVAQLALALAGLKHPAAQAFLWSALPRAAEHPSLVDAVLVALRGQELEVLQKMRDRMRAEHGLTFGSLGVLETLGVHLVIAGPKAGEALVEAIMDKQIPQLGRIALMRGATKVRGPGLSEKTLAQLASSAPDGWVRRRAAQANATVVARRARNAIRPPAQPLTSEQQALFESGRTTYGLCAACHQPDGLGRPDLAPSLKDGRWANAISPDASIRIALHGKQGTAGFPAPMPGVANMTDEQIAGVLTFVRRSFGNTSSAVSPAEIARIRREAGDRAVPWTDAELESLGR
jgi:mono/diheme cytochrome c family protein